MSVYTQDFYRAQVVESRLSASQVIPVLFKYYRPDSVVDVGCGCGSWLSEFKSLGVGDILGIDGGYVSHEQLLIEISEFLPANLSTDFANQVGRRFDLAVSLEVAEHLDNQSSADFIASLVLLSDVILFSAALPYQGGTAHINENWLEYWALLFRNHDFHPVDCIRSEIWGNAAVCWWYRQNIMVFASRQGIKDNFNQVVSASPRPLSLVHPEFFVSAYWRDRISSTQCMLHDIENYQSLCQAYLDPEMVSIPEKTISYRDTHRVRFDGILYKFCRVVDRLLAWVASSCVRR